MTHTADLLRDILVRDYKLDATHLTATTLLEELGIDSLGLAELLFIIEDEFGISMTAVNATGPAAPRLATVGDVVGAVDAAIALRDAGAATKPKSAAMESVESA